jgi:cob(I)alamin adenosyltransferase
MPDIYTRTGDDGTTSLADGTRVAKDSARVELFGAIDEANCHVGLARVHVVDSDLDEVLAFLQHRLLNCSACLATSEPTTDMPHVGAADVAALEAAIDRYAQRVGPFAGFMLPGCDEVSARLHVARAVTRRAERRAVTLVEHERVPPEVLAFLNRASDLLYVAARYAGAGAECSWDPALGPPVR